MDIQKQCLLCGENLKGRRDKKFCNPQCKSAYQYQKLQEETPPFYYTVHKQLMRNRKILKAYNKAGKATVRASVLLEEGFHPKVFTHYWKNRSGETYLFVFEYGFLKKNENGKPKFVLIKWQNFMKFEYQ